MILRIIIGVKLIVRFKFKKKVFKQVALFIKTNRSLSMK